MRLKQAISVLLFVLCGGMASSQTQAQQMLLLSTRASGSLNDPITFDIVADGNIGLAIAWGTTTALSDPIHMTYVPNQDGLSHPYRNIEKFFDTDFSDVSQINNGLMNLAFYNSNPPANFGYNGRTVLAEFQVLLGTETPTNTDLTVGLGPLGIPPYGTSIQDDQGNNLLQPTDPNHPTDNVSTAHLYVSGNGPTLRWNIGFPPAASVPEPSAWLVAATGLTMGFRLLRRRRTA